MLCTDFNIIYFDWTIIVFLHIYVLHYTVSVFVDILKKCSDFAKTIVDLLFDQTILNISHTIQNELATSTILILF